MWNIYVFPLTHPDFLNYAIAFPVDLSKCSLKVPGKGMIALQSLCCCFISLGCFLSISKRVKAERWRYFKQKAIISKALPNNESQSVFTRLERVSFPSRPWSPSVFPWDFHRSGHLECVIVTPDFGLPQHMRFASGVYPWSGRVWMRQASFHL